VVKNWNIIESGIKHELPETPCLQERQRCGKWLNIESGIKREPPECPDCSTGVVKDWNIIESGIKHEYPEPPCLQ
jgi:hypothetical protein